MTVDWSRVAERLEVIVKEGGLEPSQRASVRWIGGRLPEHGVILADEVGTGKTRIACALVRAVLESGGRVAVVVPRGLMHQWETEMDMLSEFAPAERRVAPAKCLSTLGAFTKELARSGDEAGAILPGERPEWWLISHTFRTPLVKGETLGPSVALAALVMARLMDDKEASDRRTRLGKFYTWCVDQPRFGPWIEIAAAIAGRVRRDKPLLKRLSEVPVPSPAGGNSAVFDAYRGRGPVDARALTEELLGAWLGPFDLIVVDEAHKGRDDGEGTSGDGEPQKVLARLLERVLPQSPGGRRLCMTATPMELEVEQWGHLLRRCGAAEAARNSLPVLRAFNDAIKLTAEAPDELDRVANLVDASRAFQAAMAPYVTRRRRSSLSEIKTFAASINQGGLAHAHRRVEAVRVDWDDLEIVTPAWRRAMFAAECLSAAARGGGGLAGTDASLYTRLAGGHISADQLDSKESDELVAGASAAGKQARVLYWHKTFLKARASATRADLEDLSPDAAHPRVLAAVREVERWTDIGEKVLVFGVFTAPQRHLEMSLNVRDSLRRIDRGEVVPHAWANEPAADALVRFHHRRMREAGQVGDGQLAKFPDDDVRKAWTKAHARYETDRKAVSDRAERAVRALSRRYGSAVHIDRTLLGAVTQHVTCLVMDEVLADGRRRSTDDIQKAAEEFWAARVPRHGAEVGDDDAMRNVLANVLVDERDPPVSRYCRRMHGGTRIETRQNVQHAFNRPEAAPRVLVAQSQVGREGLNLHGACRVVLQFHPEWNPGVIEQQIGRVDRKGSRWSKEAEQWLTTRDGEPPRIEVRQLIFEGTYDDRQWSVVRGRQGVFDGNLFGTLLPVESLNAMPADLRARVVAAAPDFEPPTVE